MPKLNGGGGESVFSPTKIKVQELETIEVQVSIFPQKREAVSEISNDFTSFNKMYFSAHSRPYSVHHLLLRPLSLLNL